MVGPRPHPRPALARQPPRRRGRDPAGVRRRLAWDGTPSGPTAGPCPAGSSGITRHKVADLHAQRSREARDAAAVATRDHPEPLAPPADDRLATRLLLEDALGRLGEPRSTIVRLAVVDQLTHPEVSELLGMPLGTVKSHVRRGLASLRTQMEEVTAR